MRHRSAINIVLYDQSHIVSLLTSIIEINATTLRFKAHCLFIINNLFIVEFLCASYASANAFYFLKNDVFVK